MNLQQLLQARAAKHNRQGEILNAAKAESRDLTEAEETEFDNLETEITGLDTQIEAAKKQEDRVSTHAQRQQTLSQPASAPYRNHIPGPEPTDAKDTFGFNNLAEFVSAVRFGDPQGRLDSIRNDLSMGISESGGYAVPEQFRDELLRLTAESALVRPRATVIPAGSPPDSKITIPAFQQGDSGAYGGVTVAWIGEGETKPKTDAKLDEVTLEPHEVAAHMVTTDKLLRNWKAADGFIRGLLTQAMVSAEDTAFISGDGNKKPMGVINSQGKISVPRETANTVSYLDIVTMVSKLLPGSTGNAIFIASQSLLPTLMTLKDLKGSYIFIQGDATKGIPSTLAGIPLRFTGKVKPAGTEGDLVLVDLAYYLIKDGAGPFIAASEHVYFTNNKTVIKCFWNVDGKPWVKTPLTLEDGVTKVSPYVTLGIPTA